MQADEQWITVMHLVDRHNKLVGSIETRMMPTQRRFEDAGAKSTKAFVESKASGDLRQLTVESSGLIED